jgi:radical SAM superfamily enzyme YgiQ (UPF0313 family)
MRVLLIQPEAPNLYWKMPELVSLSGKKALHPPLGLITVAALLPREWELRLVDLEIEPLTPQNWDWAEMVMISAMIVHRQGLLDLVREAKARGKIVVVGGPHLTSQPENVLAAGCDFLVRGEGENTLPLSLAALRAGRRGVVVENAKRPHLSTSPIPRFDLLKIKDYVTLGVQTSRGCPFDCEFCDVSSLFGRKVRSKATSQILAELQAIYDLGWRREIFICDDNLIGNRSQAKEFLQQLIPWMQERSQPFDFWAQTSVNLGQDLEMIDLLTAANFATVFIGVETPEEEALAAAHKYHNLRHPLAESVQNINANGLSVLASFIIGLDGEKPGAGQRICAFVEENSLPLLMLNHLVPLPNTKLWQRLHREGRLWEYQLNIDLLDKALSYVPSRPEAEIMGEYFHLWEYLYEPRRFLHRAYQSILKMRPTRAAMARKQRIPTPQVPSVVAEPLKNRIYSLLAFLLLCWRRGVMPPYRRQYWQQLLGIYRQNPSRIIRYLKILVMGEDMIRMRASILKIRKDYAHLYGGKTKDSMESAASLAKKC